MRTILAGTLLILKSHDRIPKGILKQCNIQLHTSVALARLPACSRDKRSWA